MECFFINVPGPALSDLCILTILILTARPGVTSVTFLLLQTSNRGTKKLRNLSLVTRQSQDSNLNGLALESVLLISELYCLSSILRVVWFHTPMSLPVLFPLNVSDLELSHGGACPDLPSHPPL